MATGSLRAFQVKGISFNVAGDADLEDALTQFENTLIAGVSEDIIKQEKRPLEIGGLVLLTSGADREILKDIADSGQKVSMSYTNRAGDTTRMTGNFRIEGHNTMESRTTLVLLPVKKPTVALA
jgi:hypothetical protein